MDQLIGMYAGFLIELICFFIPLLLSVLVIFEDGKNWTVAGYQIRQEKRRQEYAAQAQPGGSNHDDIAIQQGAEALKDKKNKKTLERLLSPKRQIVIIYSFLILATFFVVLQMFVREGVIINYSHNKSMLFFFLSVFFFTVALIQIGRVIHVLMKVSIFKIIKENNG